MKFSNKQNKDKFYTKESVAKEIISMLDISSYDEIIEPSSGAGAFSNNLKCIALDLYPEHSSIIKQDWFTYTHKKKGKLLIIGNPPFGKRNTLAKAFIKKAIELEADTIAFILTDSFKKPTYENVAKGYKLTKIYKLKDNSFTLKGEDYHVPCSLYVWERESNKQDLTWRKGTYTTNDFIFINEDEFVEGKDIKVKQTVSKNMINQNTGKSYCIRPNKPNLKEVFERIEFTGYSSVSGGVTSISQEEIIKNYNEWRR